MLANRWILCGLTLLVPQLLVGTASASHQFLGRSARTLEAQAEAFSQEVDAVFHDSVYERALSVEACGIIDAAHDLHQLANEGAAIGRMRGRVAVIEAKIRHLESLVRAADRRASRGFGPPLCGSPVAAYHLLQDMSRTVHHLEDAIWDLERLNRRSSHCVPRHGHGHHGGHSGYRGGTHIDLGGSGFRFHIDL